MTRTVVRPKATDDAREHPDGFAAVNVQNGAIDVGSVVDAPFGLAFELDPSRFTPLESWHYESLDSVGI